MTYTFNLRSAPLGHYDPPFRAEPAALGVSHAIRRHRTGRRRPVAIAAWRPGVAP